MQVNMEVRNKAIFDMYIRGCKTAEIGKAHGLTKQRAIQIAKSMGAPGRVYEPSDGENGWMVCKVDGCREISKTRWGTLCNTHYFRGRRTGSTADREKRGHSLTSHGYMSRSVRGHPAASPTGLLYEHREVFYGAFGKTGHRCSWCSKALEWGGKGTHKLVIDHLNGDKEDNDIGNLVASCPGCNGVRGIFMSWLCKHKDDPILKRLVEDIVRGSDSAYQTAE